MNKENEEYMQAVITRNQILKDWNEQFPLLSPYPPLSLMMKLDIFLVGIRIERSVYGGDSYIPRFTCLSLWERNTDGSLKVLISQDLTKKNVQFFVNSRNYLYYFDKSIACAKEQFGYFFGEEVPLSDFFRYIRYYYKEVYRYGKPFLTERVRLFLLQLSLASYFGDEELFKTLKDALWQDMKEWKDEQFRFIYHEDKENWIERKLSLFIHRDRFMAQVEKNSHHPKVAKLQEGHIINDANAVKLLVKKKESLYKRFLPFLD